MTSATPPTDWDWLGPDHVAAPADAMERIGAICALHTDLPTAAFVVLATHLGLPRELLATVLKRYRSELQAASVADVVSMLNALQHGGKEAFESVRRTRRKGPRAPSAGLPWGSGD